jgi:hypothetical protein
MNDGYNDGYIELTDKPPENLMTFVRHPEGDVDFDMAYDLEINKQDIIENIKNRYDEWQDQYTCYQKAYHDAKIQALQEIKDKTKQENKDLNFDQAYYQPSQKNQRSSYLNQLFQDHPVCADQSFVSKIPIMLLTHKPKIQLKQRIIKSLQRDWLAHAQETTVNYNLDGIVNNVKERGLERLNPQAPANDREALRQTDITRNIIQQVHTEVQVIMSQNKILEEAKKAVYQAQETFIYECNQDYPIELPVLIHNIPKQNIDTTPFNPNNTEIKQYMSMLDASLHRTSPLHDCIQRIPSMSEIFKNVTQTARSISPF